MKEFLVRCQGARVGGYWLPPFELGTGERLSLHLPGRGHSEDWWLFVRVLTKGEPVPGLSINGKVVCAEPAVGRRGVARFLRGELRPAGWLRSRTGISKERADELVRQWLPDAADYSINALAANPRQRLGLLAALETGAEIILYTTTGCDPLGAQTQHAVLAELLGRRAAIYCTRPVQSGGKVSYPTIPGVDAVKVALATEVTSPLAGTPAGR
jgi:hypothetical protein